MLNDRKFDRICLISIVTAALGAMLLWIFAASQKQNIDTIDPKKLLTTEHLSTDYVEELFDASYVHEINLILPEMNWNYMVNYATEEQYVISAIEIDGTRLEDVAVRPKGNSSLSAISLAGSDRFSLKVEFDHYHPLQTYLGLDKLCLNNLSSDLSCMKDFISYQMMNDAGVPAPLSSYAAVYLNGEPLGLYLAVEAIEDSFCYRNYGEHFGNLYKPECFRVDLLDPGAFLRNMDGFTTIDGSVLGPGDRLDIIGQGCIAPFEEMFGTTMPVASLQYMGENPKDYSVIFDSTVFDLTKEDEQSYIQAVHRLNEGEAPLEAVDVEEMLPFIAVHSFVNNYDSYFGVFDHNYYLREADGKLSMIPWDYNLSFGIFQADTVLKSMIRQDGSYHFDLATGNAMDDATCMVNYPIDTPTITVDMEKRPLINAVLSDPEMLDRYHQIYAEILAKFFDSGRFEQLYNQTVRIIEPYVRQGMTLYEGDLVMEAEPVARDYCLLRAESVKRQLSGALPATIQGQREDYGNLVDASSLELYKTITFDGLVFGINSSDIVAILDSITGEHSHDSQGLTESFAELSTDKSKIGVVIGRVINNCPFIRKAMGKALGKFITILLTIVVLIIALKKGKKYMRRRAG